MRQPLAHSHPSRSQMLFVSVPSFRLEVNTKPQLQQERKCVLLSNYNLPRGVQHRQATKKAGPTNKYKSSGTRVIGENLQRPQGNSIQAAFRQPSLVSDNVRNSSTLSYKVVFKQFEASQSFSTPWHTGTMPENQKVEVQVSSDLETQLSAQAPKWKLKCLYWFLCGALSCCDCKAIK